MARTPRRPIPTQSAGSLTNRVRSRLTGQPATPPGRRPHVPRYVVQARRERLVRIGIAVLAGLVLVILAGAALYQYVILPRQTLASVGDVAISREEYWQVRAVDLWNQGAQFQQFAGMVDANMAPQYQQMATEAINQIPEVWGSGDVDDGTLSRMIDDQVYLQSLDELGLAISDDEVETFLLNQFADPTAPLITPTPSPTFTPERAAMATETALALAATPIASPGPAATPIVETAIASPDATPVASPVAATPVATPNPDQARAIAESNLGLFAQALFEEARLTRESYTRLVARPALARAKIDAHLAAEVGQGAEQVQAAHILVETRDLALELSDQLGAGADFGELARQHSIDQGTAPNGGDLGSFTRDEMVAPFAEAAFALEPGQTSEPVESEFGWHIIRSAGRDSERPLTDQQITRLAQARTTNWLEGRRLELDIDASLAPTPTPVPAAFEAPVEAPPLPTPTALPAASPVASPVAPDPSPLATP
ncbi:MAG: peptidylprolyl isomerase [Chloroflexota bacterium]|nr:peptidylprolyl isomerase [Chloroflexota bacterium]